jgi:hypothetical protein
MRRFYKKNCYTLGRSQVGTFSEGEADRLRWSHPCVPARQAHNRKGRPPGGGPCCRDGELCSGAVTVAVGPATRADDAPPTSKSTLREVDRGFKEKLALFPAHTHQIPVDKPFSTLNRERSRASGRATPLYRADPVWDRRKEHEQFTGKEHHSQTNARHIHSRGSLCTKRASSSAAAGR